MTVQILMKIKILPDADHYFRVMINEWPLLKVTYTHLKDY